MLCKHSNEGDGRHIYESPLLKIVVPDTRREKKLTAGHVQKYTSVYIFELRVCRANTLLTRTTAILGSSDTLRIFSSGTDAACIKQKQV